jgi:FkbM family methyltransferase
MVSGRRIREFKDEIKGLEKFYCTVLNCIRHFKNMIWETFLVFILTKRHGSSLIIKKLFSKYMLLDLKDKGISRELAIKGIHEKNSTEYILKEINKGMVVFEMGANIGYYLLISAELVGRTGKVIAFEPSKINLNILKINTLLNSLEDRVEIYPYGVGSKNERRPFYIMSKGNTCSFINRGSDSSTEHKDVMDVEIIAIDDFCREHQLRFDFFRMDVEGFEYEILTGMRETLSREDGPRRCFIEIHSKLLKEMNQSATSCINLLKSFGFEVVKAFFRGLNEISVSSTDELLDHELLEYGYWETFFHKN